MYTISNTLKAAVRSYLDYGSMSSLSRETGIARPVLYRWLKGEREIALKTAQKLIDYFNLQTDRE